LELRRAEGSPATDIALRVMKDLLRRGFILLPEGEFGNIISFTPPLTISRNQLRAVITALNESLCRLTSL
jgi:4-aminobutyrate aminotransferase / (S)-3-amino-2-methylpropionate transaminase / 5-aminovalerate transaminase